MFRPAPTAWMDHGVFHSKITNTVNLPRGIGASVHPSRCRDAVFDSRRAIIAASTKDFAGAVGKGFNAIAGN